MLHTYECIKFVWKKFPEVWPPPPTGGQVVSTPIDTTINFSQPKIFATGTTGFYQRILWPSGLALTLSCIPTVGSASKFMILCI